MLNLVSSNYDDFDQSSDSDFEICTAEEGKYDCFCYDEENGFEYNVCKYQPNPGKLEVLKNVFPCFLFFMFKTLLKVIETCLEVKTSLNSAYFDHLKSVFVHFDN